MVRAAAAAGAVVGVVTLVAGGDFHDAGGQGLVAGGVRDGVGDGVHAWLGGVDVAHHLHFVGEVTVLIVLGADTFEEVGFSALGDGELVAGDGELRGSVIRRLFLRREDAELTHDTGLGALRGGSIGGGGVPAIGFASLDILVGHAGRPTGLGGVCANLLAGIGQGEHGVRRKARLAGLELDRNTELVLVAVVALAVVVLGGVVVVEKRRIRIHDHL